MKRANLHKTAGALGALKEASRQLLDVLGTIVVGLVALILKFLVSAIRLMFLTLIGGFVHGVMALVRRTVNVIRGLPGTIRRSLRTQPAASAASASPSVSWSPAALVLDHELVRETDHQLDELSAYRTEFVQFTGFVAAVAAATVALTSGHYPGVWGPSVTLLVGMVMLGGITLDRYRPRSADFLPPGALDRAQRFGVPVRLPDAIQLQVEYLDRRLRAQRMNTAGFGRGIDCW